MRNTISPRAQVELFREGSDTPAVLGTDYVVHVDGRWGQARAAAHVENVARQACRDTGLEWRRSVYLLAGRYLSVKI